VLAYFIQRAVVRFYRTGFPHSDISGSKPACDSPELFAACHVLHRLLAPRHPPYALSSLTIKLTQHVASPARPDSHRDARAVRAWISPPYNFSTVRYSSRTCGITHPESPSIPRAQCLFLQLSKNVGPTPGGALSWFGAASANNKKPGVKRRASPSTPSGTVSLEA
jgi:hypothetical protein